jgi:hypothetical protein
MHLMRDASLYADLSSIRARINDLGNQVSAHVAKVDPPNLLGRKADCGGGLGRVGLLSGAEPT